MFKLLCCMLFLGATLMAADKGVYDFTLNSIDGQPTIPRSRSIRFQLKHQPYNDS